MITDSGTVVPLGRLRLLVAVAGLLAGSGTARAADEPAIPGGLAEVTKADLAARVPNFFCFDYAFEPQPGKRLWLRVDDEHWVERYPDGAGSRFKILGRSKVNGRDGIVAVKIAGDAERTGTENDGSFQVFIPDKAEGEMHLFFRLAEQGEAGWNDLGAMKKVE